MSGPANPTSRPQIAVNDAKVTAIPMTMVFSLGAGPRLVDSQEHQVVSLTKVVDTKETSVEHTPIQHCMLAEAISTDMLNLGSERRSTSTGSLGGALQRPSLSESGDEQLAIRASLAGKASHKLHLPSFDNLGIASPHSAYFCPRPHLAGPIDQPQTHHCGQDSTGLGLHNFTPLGSKDHLRPSHGTSYLLTPPDDSGIIGWTPSTTTLTDTVKTSPIKDCYTMSIQQDIPVVGATNPGASEGSLPSDLRDKFHGNQNAAESGDLAPPNDDEGDATGQSLLEQAISITVSGISASVSSSYAVRVLSHALPCPSSDANVSSVTTFTSVITAIQAELQPSQRPYINVTHAVPSKFSLTNLPSSPPSTPNPAQGSDDYFNMTVFASAVPVIDHHDSNKGLTSSPAPSSPCPIVPPASIHVALVERYIPPSSVQEYLDLSSAIGPSILVDRLVELSPDGGSMLFIYPTQQGASTFVSQYLGPILDPLLRSIVVLHQLSADVGIALGKMAAVEHMVGFETMKRKINILLRKLNRGNISQTSGPTTLSHKGSYSLVYSGTQEVHLERKVWTNWWAQQETSRIRDVMGRYFKRAQRLPEDTDITSAVLVREIVDGVSSRPYGDPPAPTAGVEVGVFVIQRTS